MIGFGVLGANSFVATAAVIPAIEASGGARLASVGSRSGPINYEDVLADPAVDVVYLPLPNGLHATWAEKAAAAGKHVLCEKPLAPSAAEASRMAEVCRDAGVQLIEAWMTPFSSPWADAIAEARAGQVDSITSRFTFTIGPGNEANYRWDPEQGGGALLDVGIYALGPAVELWGSDPINLEVEIEWAPSGVDLTTSCTLTWSGGQTCHAVMSFALPEAQELHLTGPGVDRKLTGNAHTGVEGTYTKMIDAVCDAVAGTAPFPRSTDAAIALLGLLDRVRAAG